MLSVYQQAEHDLATVSSNLEVDQLQQTIN